MNPNEHTIRCVVAHRAVPDCRQRRSQTCKVQGYAAALAMLDDHESSGPPDGVESVYEGARYRKKKLGASGHATKDEKDEEQHTQRERESHKGVARHGGSFSAARSRLYATKDGPASGSGRPEHCNAVRRLAAA